MARSVLLQLARDSIQEVIEASNTINKQNLINEHPLLDQKIATVVKIFLEEELRGTSELDASNALIDNIIIASKKAAFEDKNFTPLTTSEYLHCSIEITLDTPEGIISQKDDPILKA
ncbi:AMMECR1 domain-containing protein [Sulfurimonas sp. C5]|uniref:AMMECR1 domain-containing protein n=1 Tax=Sulfurimonas sp. C5 TaxID=3036947 RepID=UPI0024587E2C|nr:AMMECR1 domain-containing protein [Sulfurimonas sp. C5]MDH4944762.1 AMMECR1 domain-containing protein [Sulfurimonas sp. C5]